MALTDGAPIAGLIGVVGLVWAVSQLYVAVDVAFARVFTQTPERDVVIRTARGFLWVAIVVALVVAVIVLATFIAAAEVVLPDGAALAPGVAGVVTSWPVLVGLGIVAVALIYRFVPSRNPVWAAVPVPAIAAGLAIGLLTQLFAFLAPRHRGLRQRGRPAGHDLHLAGLAVVLVPGPAAGWCLGRRRRPAPARGGVSPGGCRSAGRTGRWPRVTARS